MKRGGVPQKALRSGAGMVPLGLPRGEQSEDRERIFHAGKNSRLSEGLSRASVVVEKKRKKWYILGASDYETPVGG